METPKLTKYKAIFYLICLKEISKLTAWYINLKKIENKFELTKLVEDMVHILSCRKQFEDLHREIEKNNFYSHLKVIRNIIDYEKKHYLTQYRVKIINIANQKNIAGCLLQKETKDNLSLFLKAIKPKSYATKKKMIEKIDYNHLTDVFPIWISEIHNINELIIMQPNIFDLVVIDEASQVNLAEILPVIYRAKKLCIVGDHKQLSLVSTGLNLRISSKLDEMIWSKHKPGNLTYQEAEKRKIILTKASILDFIISDDKEEGINLGYIPRVTLDQHFRSLPLLFKFNNTKFYDNKLIIMTEKPPNWEIKPFKAIKINGKRRSDKTIPIEADTVVKIVKSLISNKAYENFDLSNILPPRFNIGIISPIREQVYLIREKLYIELDEEERERYEIIEGTPEELQGHERDVIIVSFCTDSESVRSKAHYENPNRFNVMTSRARFFTFFVFCEIPGNFTLTRQYLKFMGYELENQNTIQEYPHWKFDEKKFESEFERIVYHYLLQYKLERKSVEIYNQVESCGKRIDFVVYNPFKKKFVAIEVDGKHHFEKDGITPTKYHQERIEILKTAGWKIINTPYYKWFDHTGRLKSNQEIDEVVNNLYNDLDQELGVAGT
ncbi:MAG: AAA domain-containing protein [Candidatus Calescibacterium sp.]|nr:AAA domain-containing protein [Candidatus Calescibacterium sp.]MDW8133335.1 AAA domain-containing protein [Candidatus Calescibacterium sp.]